MKLAYLAAALLGIALPALAQSQTPEWITDRTNGCGVSNPSPKPNETISWSGKCANGKAEGRGVLQWFRDGKPTGRYEGEYRGGRMNGRGVYAFSNGNRYEGDWLNDDFHGRGAFIYANGNRYDGEFRNDRPNGVGTYKRADGTTYSGSWTNGCFRQGDRWATVMATAEQCGFK